MKLILLFVFLFTGSVQAANACSCLLPSDEEVVIIEARKLDAIANIEVLDYLPETKVFKARVIKQIRGSVPKDFELRAATSKKGISHGSDCNVGVSIGAQGILAMSFDENKVSYYADRSCTQGLSQAAVQGKYADLVDDSPYTFWPRFYLRKAIIFLISVAS